MGLGEVGSRWLCDICKKHFGLECYFLCGELLLVLKIQGEKKTLEGKKLAILSNDLFPTTDLEH